MAWWPVPRPIPRTAVPLQQLADAAGAGSVTLEWQPASAAIELEDAITPEQMDVALRAGWAEAERAADEGIEMLVLAAGGAGASAAAVAVISAITGYEATALLGRVVTPAGLYDDNAWMTRCLALRDALHRVRHRDGDPRTVLSALGGADIAAATGLMLGAASRRTAGHDRRPGRGRRRPARQRLRPARAAWLLMPDTGRNVAVSVAAEALELRPWLDLCLDLGEGVTSLAALPMLQTALTLAGAGEPVEAGPLTRFDSATGGQIFVGVARPVEPAEEPPRPRRPRSRPRPRSGPRRRAGRSRPRPSPARRRPRRRRPPPRPPRPRTRPRRLRPGPAARPVPPRRPPARLPPPELRPSRTRPRPARRAETRPRPRPHRSRHRSRHRRRLARVRHRSRPGPVPGARSPGQRRAADSPNGDGAQLLRPGPTRRPRATREPPAGDDAAAGPRQWLRAGSQAHRNRRSPACPRAPAGPGGSTQNPARPAAQTSLIKRADPCNCIDIPACLRGGESRP